MDQLRNQPVDVNDLLNELEKEEVPPMSAEFEATAMKKISKRKNELEQEESRSRLRRSSRNGWKTLLSIAAAFVFLIGGTLLTRGSLRTEKNWGPGITKPIILPTLRTDSFSVNSSGILQEPQDQTQTEESEKPQDPTPTEEIKKTPERNQAVLFLEDMWLFLKASLPWLGCAVILASLLGLIRNKLKSRRE